MKENIKKLKHLGEIEYNFTNMLSEIEGNRENDAKWLKETTHITLNDENTVKNMTPEITKTYVAAESEHIFERTTNDICQRVGNSCQIILRGDKHFFEAEVENER